MDFTLTTYKKLLNTLQSQGFSFLTFAQYIEAKSSNPKEPSIATPETSNLESGILNLESPQQINKFHPERSRRTTNQQINPLNFESSNPQILKSSNLQIA